MLLKVLHTCINTNSQYNRQLNTPKIHKSKINLSAYTVTSIQVANFICCYTISSNIRQIDHKKEGSKNM